MTATPCAAGRGNRRKEIHAAGRAAMILSFNHRAGNLAREGLQSALPLPPTTKKTEIALYGLPERNFFTESKAYTMNIARPQYFRLDKITAARRQLGTAIELLFENRDVVSICVLMHGAWSIVNDLMKLRELESSRDWMLEHFPNMSETEVWKELTSVWTFCKHAKKRPGFRSRASS
jgi:hypothetical protein